MFLFRKVAWSGIVFLSVAGPRPTPLISGADLSTKLLAAPHPNDVNGMQQTLLDKGHYRGKVDGVLGLRTRAGIREYQRAEKLPVTGRVDKETASRLGVRPEGREEKDFNTTQAKPPAGIKWPKGSGRAYKAPQTPVKRTRPVQPT